MDPRKNPILYQRRAREAMLDHSVNNDDRWIKFFSRQKSDAEFETMARRLALENKTEEEIDRIEVPKIEVPAIRNKFNSISRKLQSYGLDLEDNTEFSREIYELRLLVAGREIRAGDRNRTRFLSSAFRP